MSSNLPDGLALPEECPVPAALGPPPPAPRSAWVLAGVALAVRGAAACLDPVPPRDGMALAETVRSAAAGHLGALLDAVHPPLASALATPLAAAGLDPVTALAVVAVLASALAVLPLHSLARRAFDLDAANAAALLYAVTPPLVRIGSTAFAEPLLFLLGLLSLDAAHRALRHWRPARDAAMAGLWAGAAYLARLEALALLPLVLGAPLLAGAGRPWRNRLLGFGAGLLAFILVAGPWVAAEGAGRGGLEVVPGKSLAVLAGGAPPATQGGAAPAARPTLPRAVMEAVGALPEAMHPALAVLALLGVGSLFGRRRCGKVLGPPLFTLAAALLFLGGVVLLEWRYGYGGRRHASMAGVVLVPFAGAGLLLAGNLLAKVGGPLRRPVAALGLALALVVLPMLAGSLLQRDVGGAEAREVGRAIGALRAAGTPPPRIATYGDPRVAWYADGVDVRLVKEYRVRAGSPPGDAARVGDALRWFLGGRNGADFVVLWKGDDRIPPGVPGPGAGEPVAVSGNLRAWRTAGIR